MKFTFYLYPGVPTGVHTWRIPTIVEEAETYEKAYQQAQAKVPEGSRIWASAEGDVVAKDAPVA